MFNTFALTLRPDDLKATLIWVVTLRTALALRTRRMALATASSWLRRSGTVVLAPVQAVLGRTVAPRLEARWTRGADGQLRCQWGPASQRRVGQVIALHCPPLRPLPDREVA